MFPLQTGCTGPSDEPDLASAVFDSPVLRSVTEFDMAGPGDLELAKFMQANGVVLGALAAVNALNGFEDEQVGFGFRWLGWVNEAA